MLVLICEDDDGVSQMLKDSFEQARIDVVQAFSVQQAREALAAHPDIQAVTMDGNIPLFTGGKDPEPTDGLVEHIHTRRPDLRGKVFALAGDTTGRDRLLLVGAVGVLGRRSGDGYAIKPFAGSLVINAVITLLKG